MLRHVEMRLHDRRRLRGEFLDRGDVAVLSVAVHQDQRFLVGVDLLGDVAAVEIGILCAAQFVDQALVTVVESCGRGDARLLAMSSAFSLSLVAVWAAIILAAKDFTSALEVRSFAIFAAATSYMSLWAASAAKPFKVVVISAEITPSVWRAASFTELIVSLVVPGAGL